MQLLLALGNPTQMNTLKNSVRYYFSILKVSPTTGGNLCVADGDCKQCTLCERHIFAACCADVNHTHLAQDEPNAQKRPEMQVFLPSPKQSPSSIHHAVILDTFFHPLPQPDFEQPLLKTHSLCTSRIVWPSGRTVTTYISEMFIKKRSL